MVLPIVIVFQFVRSTSAETETQKQIMYRSAEGWIADGVTNAIDAQQRPVHQVVTQSYSCCRSTRLTRNKTANETASRMTDSVSATFSSCSKPWSIASG